MKTLFSRSSSKKHPVRIRLPTTTPQTTVLTTTTYPNQQNDRSSASFLYRSARTMTPATTTITTGGIVGWSSSSSSLSFRHGRSSRGPSRWIIPTIMLLIGLSIGLLYENIHVIFLQNGGWSSLTTTPTTTTTTASSRSSSTHKKSSIHKYLPITVPDSEFLPLILGAGMSGTGSRHVFAATCRLGIPSVHEQNVCLVPYYDDDDGGGGSSQEYDNPSLGYALAAHARIQQIWKQLISCAQQSRTLSHSEYQTMKRQRQWKETKTKWARHNPSTNTLQIQDFYQEVGSTTNSTTNTCHHFQFNAWVEELLDTVSQVIDYGIVSLHGSPYPQLLSLLRHYNRTMEGVEIPPLLVMTQRNPTDWSTDTRLMTKPFLACWPEYDNDNDDEEETNHEDASHMDFLECWTQSILQEPSEFLFSMSNLASSSSSSSLQDHKDDSDNDDSSLLNGPRKAFQLQLAHMLDVYQTKVLEEWNPVWIQTPTTEDDDDNDDDEDDDIDMGDDDDDDTITATISSTTTVSSLWHALKPHLHPTALEQLREFRHVTQQINRFIVVPPKGGGLQIWQMDKKKKKDSLQPWLDRFPQLLSQSSAEMLDSNP